MSCGIISAIGKDLYLLRIQYTYTGAGSTSINTTVYDSELAESLTDAMGGTKSGFYFIQQIEQTIERSAAIQDAAYRIWIGKKDFNLLRAAVMAMGTNEYEDTKFLDIATTDFVDYDSSAGVSKAILKDINLYCQVSETSGSPAIVVEAIDSNHTGYVSGDKITTDIIFAVNDRQ